jgi:hypothetical protein
MRRGTAAAAIADLERREKRAKLARLRVRQSVSKAAMMERSRAIKREAKDTLARIRGRAKELRDALRVASAAARELSKYIAPGARVLIHRQHATALRTLADEHQRITHEVSAERARLRPDGSHHSTQRTTAAERAHESDDEVRQNISAELLPAFEAWRRRVKATPRMTRTEAFLQLAHDNPADAARLYFEAAEQSAMDEPEESEHDYRARAVGRR